MRVALPLSPAAPIGIISTFSRVADISSPPTKGWGAGASDVLEEGRGVGIGAAGVASPPSVGAEVAVGVGGREVAVGVGAGPSSSSPPPHADNATSTRRLSRAITRTR